MTSEPRPIYPKHFFEQPVERRSTGLILMPFARDFDDVHAVIRRAIEAAGLEPFRIDDEHLTRAAMEKLLRGVGEAEAVVADLTGRNANVFYELGISHVMKENVVMLAQSIAARDHAQTPALWVLSRGSFSPRDSLASPSWADSERACF